jgi:hypothetical protein
MVTDRKIVDLVWGVVHKLREEEKDNVIKYILSFDRRLGKIENKTKTLFNVIATDIKGDISDEQYQVLIYGKPQFEAYKKMILRLRNKMLESLIMDVNLDKEGNYSARSKTIYRIRKKLSYAHILQSRSLVSQALKIYDSIIKEGIEFEIWSEVIQALSLKKWIISVSQSEANFKEVSTLLRVCRNKLKGLERAEDLIAYVSMIENHRKWTETDSLELKEKINQINERYSQHKSLCMEYIMIQCEIQYLQKTKQYKSAEQKLVRLVNLSKSEKATATPSRHSSALLNLAENYIYMGSFALCQTHANEALKNISPSHITALRCYELLYYSAIYNGDYMKSITLINKCIFQIEENGWDFIKDKWEYLKACSYFAMGQYEIADKILADFRQIEFDKEGYGIHLKFLLFMISFERNKRSILFTRIEGLRKQIQILHKKGKKVVREKAIYEILRELSNTSFDFAKTFEKKGELLNKIKSNELYKWSVLSPEIILFEQWFICKLNGTAFTQKINIIEFSNLPILSIAK